MQMTSMTDFPPRYTPNSHAPPPEDLDNQPPQAEKTPHQEGHHEAIKDNVKETDKNRQKLDELVSNSKSLFKLESVFPFDLFPTIITIDVNQINIYKKEFFWSGRRQSILIKNVLDVLLDTSILFSSLKIIDRSYVDNITVIKNLPTKAAKKARRLIQGLVVAHLQDIDVSKLEVNELVGKLEELGRLKEQE